MKDQISTMIRNWLILFLISILFLIDAEETIDADWECTNGVFDTASLECSLCSELSSDDTLELVPSDHQTHCLTCDSTFNATYDSDSLVCSCPTNWRVYETQTQQRCEECPANYTVDVSSDPFTCVECVSPMIIVNDTCECPSSDHTSTVDGQECVSNDDVNELTYSLSDAQSLILYDVLNNNNKLIKQMSINSSLISKYYLTAAIKCQAIISESSDSDSSGSTSNNQGYLSVNRRWCQALANLCALTLYDDTSAVCQMFNEILESTSSIKHGFTNWKQGLPYLKISDSLSSVLKSENLQLGVGLYTKGLTMDYNLGDPANHFGNINQQNTRQFLDLLLLKYSMNGTFLGSEVLNTQLSLCLRDFDPLSQARWKRVGNNYQCYTNNVKLHHIFADEYNHSKYVNSNQYSSLREEEGTVFYDPYLLDSDGKIFPLGVKVLNHINSEGNRPNLKSGSYSKENMDSSTMILHRRFFRWDCRLGGYDTGLVTFLKSSIVRIPVIKPGSKNVYPPHIVVRYSSHLIDLDNPNNNVNKGDHSFSVNWFLSDLSSFTTSVISVFSVLIILILLLWISLLYIQHKTATHLTTSHQGGSSGPSGSVSGGSTLSLSWFGRSLCVGLGISADVFFAFLYLISAYCYLSFKGQSEVQWLDPVPGDRLYLSFTVMIVYSCCAKFIHLLMLLYDQVNVDIFLVDWEKPRGFGSSGKNATNTHSDSHSLLQQQSQHHPQMVQQQHTMTSMNMGINEMNGSLSMGGLGSPMMVPSMGINGAMSAPHSAKSLPNTGHTGPLTFPNTATHANGIPQGLQTPTIVQNNSQFGVGGVRGGGVGGPFGSNQPTPFHNSNPTMMNQQSQNQLFIQQNQTQNHHIQQQQQHQQQQQPQSHDRLITNTNTNNNNTIEITQQINNGSVNNNNHDTQGYNYFGRNIDSSRLMLGKDVSAWRRLFIANEWNEIQTYRRIDLSLTLLLLLLFLKGLNLENLATSQPLSKDLSSNSAPNSIIFRFQISMFFFLLLSLVQRLYISLIHGRFVENKLADLVDVCSLANISVWVLDRYSHGYYIHGKSVHPRSECSLLQMNRNIEKQRRGLTRQPGLLGGGSSMIIGGSGNTGGNGASSGTGGMLGGIGSGFAGGWTGRGAGNRGSTAGSDDAIPQTFEVFLSRDFRKQYSQIFSEIYESSSSSSRSNTTTNGNSSNNNNNNNNMSVSEANNGGMSGMNEAGVSTFLPNMFLSDFIEKSSPHLWEVREKSGLELLSLIGPLPDSFTEKNTLLYPNESFDFRYVLLQGIEHHLCVFLALLYATVDLATHNTVVSVLLTYLANRLIVFARGYFGEINLSKKTLIDDKFLF